jgi:hypothetical protein
MQLAVPASREMLREMPVVLWIQVIIIVVAIGGAAWELREVLQKPRGQADKIQAPAELEAQSHLPDHMPRHPPQYLPQHTSQHIPQHR